MNLVLYVHSMCALVHRGVAGQVGLLLEDAAAS
jgi:hypothetical protein